MTGAGDRESGPPGHRGEAADDRPQETLVEIVVPPGQGGGVRLDHYLTDKLPNVTRSKVQRGIKEGRVSVNDAVLTKPSYPVQPGDRIVCRILRPPPLEVVPEPIPLDVVYEDAWLLVVDKPAGMVVHPAYGHRSGTLVNALLHHVGAGPLAAADLDDDEDDEALGLSTAAAGPRFEGDPTVRPGLVHRLDKDTSGLLVVAKDDATHAALARQFAERTIRRRYLALVWGVPDPPAGRVETWLGRDPRDRKRVAVRPEGQGKWAATNYETAEAHRHTALVRFRLETGRTHQIRVHALHLGHPLLNDATYGGDRIRAGPDTARRRQFSRTSSRRCRGRPSTPTPSASATPPPAPASTSRRRSRTTWRSCVPGCGRWKGREAAGRREPHAPAAGSGQYLPARPSNRPSHAPC